MRWLGRALCCSNVLPEVGLASFHVCFTQRNTGASNTPHSSCREIDNPQVCCGHNFLHAVVAAVTTTPLLRMNSLEFSAIYVNGKNAYGKLTQFWGFFIG